MQSDDKDPIVSSVDDMGFMDELNEREHEEAPIGWKTWVALTAFVFNNFAIVFAIGGPPFVLNEIAETFDAADVKTWVPNSLSLVQAVTAPLLAFASDMFQARLMALLIPLGFGAIGAGIIPNSNSIGRVIAGQSLIGVALASITLSYSVPSELAPRRWRPLVQSVINTAAALGFVAAPFIGAGFTRTYGPTQGWRYFYWVLMSLFLVSLILLALCYRPPPRHALVQNLSAKQKLRKLDLLGAFLLAAGLSLLLAGLNLGGNPRPWSSAPVIALLAVGGAVCIAFGIWEWKGTREGILHHRLFSINRNFGLLSIIMLLEGFVLFAFIIFFSPMVEAIYETDLLTVAVYQMLFFIVIPPVTIVCGYFCYKTRRQVEFLAVSWLVWMGGYIGLANIQPGSNSLVLGMSALSGMGYSIPLVLVISLSQLSIPKELIATGTAVLTTARAVGATTATAVYSVALNNRLNSLIPEHVAPAAIAAGLPEQSIAAFIGALANDDTSALSSVPGVTPSIIDAGLAALLQALCDGFRVIFIIAAPICALACVLTVCLVNVPARMSRYVDAPIEVDYREKAALKDQSLG